MRRPKSEFMLTRRQFAVAGVLGGAAAVIGCRTSNGRNAGFFSDSDARTLAALCDQIIPADDFPSASQAGAVAYIDRQLARHYKRHRDVYLEGLKQIDTLSHARHGRAFADAIAAEQLEIVSALERENRKFFDLVRQHTMEGYYGSPRHGGNRDAASWRMLGLDEPPLRGRAQYDLRKGSGA